MEGLLKKFFKHALRCNQCHKHPDNPCAIGELILSAAASAFIISAQHHAHLTPESLASSQAVTNASAVSQSDGDTPPAQAQVA